MKRSIYISLVLFFTLTSCEDSYTPKEYHISVLIDRTEAQGSIAPTGQYILEKLPNSHPSDGLELSISTIGDTQYSKRQSFLLEKGETGWLANEDMRKKQYRNLKQSFSDTLQVLNNKSYSYTRSEIFRTTIKELNRLGKKLSHRELWLFSDLKEHSFFSVYDPTQLYLLIKNPKKVAQIFEKQVDLAEDLNGITLRLMYQPTLEEAEVFTAMVALYKSILSPRGVIVKVGIDNQIKI